jgi:hypothetical protein
MIAWGRGERRSRGERWKKTSQVRIREEERVLD